MSSTNPRNNTIKDNLNDFKLSDNFTNDVDNEDEDDDDYPVTCEDIFGPCQGANCPGFCSDCIE